MNSADRQKIANTAASIVENAAFIGDTDINIDHVRESLIDSDRHLERYYAVEILREVRKQARKAGLEIVITVKRN